MADPARRDSSRDKVRRYRERLRASGLRPIQLWVPDVASARFREEAHYQSRLAAESPGAEGDQAFIESIVDSE